MKKSLFFTALTAFTISTATSQVIQKTVPAVKPNVIIKTVPATPPPPSVPPPTTNKTAGTANQNTPVYTLTAVRVIIRTGADNKEFPSGAGVSLWRKDRQGWDYTNYCCYKTPTLKTEMAVNSSTDLGLDKYAGNTDKWNLATLQASGLELVVDYAPNLIFDAWKIENISLILEFKDQNGNLHPTLGNKTIAFSSAVGFLNSEYSSIKCTTNQNFNPLTASIEK